MSVFSRVPVTCVCEVSVGCLASVQGFVSSPCPSRRHLAQSAAATLGLAAGSCLAVKWVVCTGVGIALVPSGLAGTGAQPGVECRCLGSQQAGAAPTVLVPGAAAHRGGCLCSLLSSPAGLRSLPNCIFHLSCLLFPICFISPGAELPSQVRDLGPARVGMTYFKVLCFLLKNI